MKDEVLLSSNRRLDTQRTMLKRENEDMKELIQKLRSDRDSERLEYRAESSESAALIRSLKERLQEEG